MKVTYYTKENCSLCEKGLLVLEAIKKDFPLEIELVDIYKDDALLEKYQIMIPVVEINGEEVDFGILSEAKIRSYLKSL
ncbi:glutaredoxin family protein [Anaerobacillus sp. CMMVII]|uniref:glutaredoxin family protein n=1 Tax=Anaerobacillus sp. CMMVII TaxID=2755588 RepID=UPI0021B71F8F|nr:glutaredoxin family protein [Anaerobacillus sp. CMMVII]MCT8140214.1 glutaredoxin family protein [Anaerobacillus sp. CMMVII]